MCTICWKRHDSNREIEFERRYSFVSSDADHHCFSGSCAECGCAESMDGVLQDSSERYSCSYYVERGRAYYVGGNFLGGMLLVAAPWSFFPFADFVPSSPRPKCAMVRGHSSTQSDISTVIGSCFLNALNTAQ
jgi:hypothetical protein